ncbi:General transcription factor IIH subunit 1 [Trichuris trichiura]|uniref:General transcription factor IIH subunit 1 n=1 Tax=Trichuris trichiura TaxID=36087 RepID=A0A077YW81_TRITR|nr:General transcription factor IIH subunit 1 [Trichuris trichiura]
MEKVSLQRIDEKDVIMYVGYVLSKKHGMGTLYVTQTKIAWQSEVESGLQVCVEYDKMRCKDKLMPLMAQRISPAGKAKVQLQICLQNDSNVTFQFCNPLGTERQTEERDSVKDLLQTMISKFKRVPSADLEQKQKILQTHPELLKLYEDLVTTGIIKADDFWPMFAADVMNNETKEQQKLGVSGGFLGDVVRSDVCNEVKFSLTSEIIDSIFLTYPAVKKKHAQLVPREMDETEFWTHFFQSQYFHRDRNQAPGAKEFFSDCLEIDNEDFRSQLERYYEDDPENAVATTSKSIFQEMADEANDEDGLNKASTSSLVNRLNYHSNQVIKAHGLTSAGSSADTVPVLKADMGNHYSPNSKKRKLTLAKRLECEELLKNDNRQDGAVVELNIADPSHFQSYAAEGSSDFTEADMVRWTNLGFDESAAFNTILKIFSAQDKDDSLEAVKSRATDQLIGDIQSAHFVLMELLRKFWHSFPPLTPEAEQKVASAMETLQKYEECRLKPLSNFCVTNESAAGEIGIEDLYSCLKMAYSKYENWQQRKRTQNHR